MTPAIKTLEQRKAQFQIHQYQHHSDCLAYGEEAAEALGVSADKIFKTLITQLNTGELVAALVPVNTTLNLKALARASGAKKAAMADAHQAERTTGYVLGGVSPLGQKTALRTLIDSSAQALASIYVSAGKRGLEVELAPAELASLTKARFADIAQR